MSYPATKTCDCGMCPDCRRWDKEYVTAEVARLKAEDRHEESADLIAPRKPGPEPDLHEGREFDYEEQGRDEEEFGCTLPSETGDWP